MATIRVLIADDHVVVREGTRKILERDAELTVVGEAADGDAAVALAERLEPDIVLMDLSLPGMSGIEATRRIRSRREAARVLILSVYDDEDYVVAAIEAGASGYLSKAASAPELTAAIRAVADGAVVFHAGLAQNLLARSRRPGPTEILTPRELEILSRASEGKKTQDIAAQLAVSVRTVEADLSSIFAKLGVSSRTEAVAKAVAKGWIHPEGQV